MEKPHWDDMEEEDYGMQNTVNSMLGIKSSFSENVDDQEDYSGWQFLFCCSFFSVRGALISSCSPTSGQQEGEEQGQEEEEEEKEEEENPPASMEEEKKKFDDYLEKYYSLNFEDLIAGEIPCRFKYRYLQLLL